MGQQARVNEPFNLFGMTQSTGWIPPSVIEPNSPSFDRVVAYNFPATGYGVFGATTSIVFELSSLRTLPRRPIIEAFSDRHDVDAIYLSPGNPPKIIVLTSHKSYERTAMSELFERELNLIDQLKNFSVEVDFVPLLGRDPDDLTPKGATVLYSRE